MQAHLSDLQRLLIDKRSSDKSFLRIIEEQKMVMRGCVVFEDGVITKIRTLEKAIFTKERYAEFNIDMVTYQKLLKEKNVAENVEHLFAQEVGQLKQCFFELNALFELQKKLFQEFIPSVGTSIYSGFVPDSMSPLFEKEASYYLTVQEIIDRINANQEVLGTYLRDMQKLTYSRSAIKSGQIISKLIKNVLFKVVVQGVENIPRSGPCVLAPRHYHAAFDSPLLISVVNRNLYFLASIETFVDVPTFNKMFLKLGAIPWRRNDGLFRPRKASAVSKEKVDAYTSSNFASSKKFFSHLKYGEAVVIFPEGDSVVQGTYERSVEENFFPPQAGFVEIALLAQNKFGVPVPIIPIGIKYSSGFRKEVIINIGKPYVISQQISLAADNISKIVIELFEIIKQLSR